MVVNEKSYRATQLVINIFFILVCVTFLVPLLIVISSSLTSDASIQKYGYPILPRSIDTAAYSTLFRSPEKMINAYGVTIFISIVGSVLSTIVMGLVAYPLSRPDFAYRKGITFYIFFTMLFSGGMIPSYILTTQYLHLTNNIWVYILPSLAGAWNIIIMRTFFQSIPLSLIESAKIDGAKEMTIFVRVIIPLSKPVIATIGLFCLLGKWNEWMTTLLYIRDERLYTLQYMLQRILREVQFVKDFMQNLQIGGVQTGGLESELPTLSMRYAMTVVAAGPMLVIFPFFQKYFTKGLTIGAVKG